MIITVAGIWDGKTVRCGNGNMLFTTTKRCNELEGFITLKLINNNRVGQVLKYVPCKLSDDQMFSSVAFFHFLKDPTPYFY